MSTVTAIATPDDLPPPPPADRPGLYTVVADLVAYLNWHNGCDRTEQGLRILKVTEEAGEAAAAWIGHVGQNPRKPATHGTTDVAAELADVAFTALVAIASLGQHPAAVMADCAAKVATRIHRPAPDVRADCPLCQVDPDHHFLPL